MTGAEIETRPRSRLRPAGAPGPCLPRPWEAAVVPLLPWRRHVHTGSFLASGPARDGASCLTGVLVTFVVDGGSVVSYHLGDLGCGGKACSPSLPFG